MIPPAKAQASYGKEVGYLILVCSLVRLFFACTLELGNDEAYYWIYSQHLQWNYFDHPPMVAAWIRLFTLDLSLQDYEGFLRLGSVAGCALSAWFLYRAVALIHSEKAGFYAAVLYQVSFYAAITAGIFILPDSPQMVFWTAAMLVIARLERNDKSWLNWILMGITAGLCILSKVHGVFIWLGLGLYTLVYRRTWLTDARFYTALLLTVLITSPILFWNIGHQFVTYRFHSKRVTLDHPVNGSQFLVELTSQFFFNNPFNVVLTILGMNAFFKRGRNRRGARTIYLMSGIPLALILLFLSVFRKTLPHWSGPAYVVLLPFAAIYLAELHKPLWKPALLRFAVSGFILFLTSWFLVIHFSPGTWGSKRPVDYGRGDLTLDMKGWKDAGARFAGWYRKMHPGPGPVPPLVCWKWWGAHVEYYFARPAGTRMAGLGAMDQVHHYYWLNRINRDVLQMDTVYCVIPSDEQYDAVNAYRAYYTTVESIMVLPVVRGGRPAHHFYVLRLSGWQHNLPYLQLKGGEAR